MPSSSVLSAHPRRQPRVCVVGTGALGSAFLDRLRQHGFRSVLAIDPDEVEERNLILSPMLRRAVLNAASQPASVQKPVQNSGRNKAMLLAEAARSLDGLPWRSAPSEIADVGWQTLRARDVLCCCTDSVLSRVETAWIARTLGQTMLDGAVFGQGVCGGRVTIFPAAASAACFLCGLSEERRAAVLSFAASASLGCQAPESVPAMTGTVSTLNTVADAMLDQLLQWQQVAGSPARSTRFSQEANGTWDADAVDLTCSCTCPWHDMLPGGLEPLPWNTPVSAALRGGGRELILSWPVCTEALCDACGARTSPMQRVATVRRSVCLACQQQCQQPVRCLDRIRHGDPASGFSPRQLGMPRRHLYWLR